jgi:antitoxin VapB
LILFKSTTEDLMPLQIANPVVVEKVERLARITRLSKTAAVEKAVDALLRQQQTQSADRVAQRMDAILAQLDRIPDLPRPIDPLEWDENGLPT